MDMPDLERGQQARCQRCHQVIAVNSGKGMQRCCALSVSALLLLSVIMGFPLMEITILGQSRAVSLLDTVNGLLANEELWLGMIVLLFILVVPALVLLMLCVLCGGLMMGVRNRSWYWMARLYYFCREWNMIEVYLLGLVVSLSRIMALAGVDFGLSFWALILFCLCFLAAAYSVDRYQLWRTIRELSA